MTGTVVAVCVSPGKGTVKTPVPVVQVTPTGIRGDAHAGQWHRQVSLLAQESMAGLSAQSGRTFQPGDFAENITTAGIDLGQVAIRDRLQVGQVDLEVTQIGKQCHGAGCAIHRAVGKCVMPTEGIFARVLRGGEIRAGDSIEHRRRPLTCLVLTLSDRAFRGTYADQAGPAVEQALQTHFAGSRWGLEITRTVLPDDAELLRAALQGALDGGTDVIITTGGTGIGPRDITPEVVRPLLTKELPGIMEVVRTRHAQALPQAALSRAMAGVAGTTTLVYALPGSPRAVGDYMQEILKTLEHALLMLWGIDAHQQAPEAPDPVGRG
jgi:molybdenum cofactor synthesis domain-containing protein